MRLAIAVPEEEVSAGVLNAGLEATTRLNERLLEHGKVPTFREAVSAGAVKWQAEPPGDERFDHAGIVLGRGNGDCDDLAPWHAASLRVTGEDPDAEAFVTKSGKHTWHALVRRGDGSVQDPSKAAGMHGARGVVVGGLGLPQGQRPAVLPSMFAPTHVVGGGRTRPSLAARRIGASGWWESRADAPWKDTAYGLASLSRSPVASQAIVGSLLGAVCAGLAASTVKPHDVRRMVALAGICDGHDPDEIADECGDEAVERALALRHALRVQGLSFGKIFHAFEPMLAKVVSFVPGVGPIASTALDITNKLVPDGAGPPPAGPPPPAPHGSAPTVPVEQHPPAPPGEALAAHFAAMEAYPGGPVVMRF